MEGPPQTFPDPRRDEPGGVIMSVVHQDRDLTRILFLALDVDLGTMRGEAAHTIALARGLAAVGDSVELVVGSTPDAVRVEGVRLTSLKRARDLHAVSTLSRLVKRAHIDAIYERRFSPKIGWSLASLHDVPLVVEINGIPMDEARMQGRPYPPGPLASTKGLIRDNMLRKADAVIAVTPGLKQALVRRFGLDPERTFVVPNGVDDRLFVPGNQLEGRRLLGLGPGPWVSFVGNLVRWQGLTTLLEAAVLTPSEFRFNLVGDGPDLKSLQRQSRELDVAERVTFFGRVDQERVPVFIAASDVCVAPFTSERNLQMGVSPLKLYEYLACARPVVVSDVPGAADLVRRLEAGAVVTPDKPGELSDAIVSVAGESKWLDHALHASDIVRKEYSWSATAVKVSAVLRDVVAR